jgi:hypothetical protein
VVEGPVADVLEHVAAVLNGAMPSQDAPSPPIWVKPVVSRPIQVVMKWQPIPATALLPSGTFVLVLCGQPGQNQGSRTSAAGLPASRARRRSSSGSEARSCGSPGPLDEPPRQRLGDGQAVERAVRGEQRLAPLVPLADQPRPVVQVVEDLLRLALDQAALLLHHHHEARARDGLLQPLRLQRVGHPDLVDPQAQRLRARLVEPELVQRRHHVLPALAGGHERQVASPPTAPSTTRSIRFARAKALAASSLWTCSSRSTSSASGGQGCSG